MGRLLVSTRKGLFVLAGEGTSWEVESTAFLGDRVSLALHDRRQKTMIAALDHGHFGVKMQRSTDHGASWSEIPAPAFPPKPDGHSDTDGSGREIPWNVKLVWALETGGADKPGWLWAGTIPGGLFLSTDSGESWALNEALWNEPRRSDWFGGGADWPGIHSIVVDPRNSDRVLVAVSCGGVWESLDAGATWDVRAKGMRADFMPPEKAGNETTQDPHCMVPCPSKPDHLWVQHHCGIWRSTDGAASWTEVENVAPSSFGFPVVVHPEDSDTAWFIPAVSDQHRIPVDGKLVVNRTRDGGATFETLSAGLPSEHAYDSVFRHALTLDDAGEQLAFGTTTGSLFVSADQGDHWTPISTHLPPIYAVRFA